MDISARRTTDSGQRAADLLARTQHTCGQVLREAVGWLPEPLHALAVRLLAGASAPISEDLVALAHAATHREL